MSRNAILGLAAAAMFGLAGLGTAATPADAGVVVKIGYYGGYRHWRPSYGYYKPYHHYRRHYSYRPHYYKPYYYKPYRRHHYW